MWNLLDGASFVTRGHCGEWSPELKALYIFANAMIALAYFAVLPMTVVFWRKRRNDIAGPWVLACFAIAVALCGLTHVADIVVFYWAPYRLFTLISLFCAVASDVAVILLPGVVKAFLKLPSRDVIHHLTSRLQHEVLLRQIRDADLESRNQDLRQQIQSLELEVENDTWLNDKSTAVQHLHEMLLKVGGPPDGS